MHATHHPHDHHHAAAAAPSDGRNDPDAHHAHHHAHDHGHIHATPAFRLDPPVWSLVRAALGVRLSIAALLVAAIWTAVLATIWSAA